MAPSFRPDIYRLPKRASRKLWTSVELWTSNERGRPLLRVQNSKKKPRDSLMADKTCVTRLARRTLKRAYERTPVSNFAAVNCFSSRQILGSHEHNVARKNVPRSRLDYEPARQHHAVTMRSSDFLLNRSSFYNVSNVSYFQRSTCLPNSLPKFLLGKVSKTVGNFVLKSAPKFTADRLIVLFSRIRSEDPKYGYIVGRTISWSE